MIVAGLGPGSDASPASLLSQLHMNREKSAKRVRNLKTCEK